MTGVGDTLRSARELRGESLTTVAEALGVDVADVRRLEDGPVEDARTAAWAAPLVARYAARLGLDGARLADEVRAQFGDHPDEDTQRLRAVGPAPRRREPALAWIGAGAVAGVAALVVLGGGIGSGGNGGGSAPPAQAGATTVPSPPAPAAVATVRPTPPSRPAIALELGARPGRTVWVEVRRGGASGAPLFAGLVGGGVTRRFTSSRPLWLGVAWAPNVTVRVNGEELDAEGGTESYLVTVRGLTRFRHS